MSGIDELIETYLTACEVEGKSPNTTWSYRTSLEDFRRSGSRLGLPDVVEDYRVPHVYQFLHEVRARGASAAYQHRRDREVKAFFSWCKRMDIVQENVFARVPLVKLEQQIIQPFSAVDIEALLAAQDRSRSHDCRNYALILFLLDTGVRASECISIRLDDVDWVRGRVRVLHGKGQKQRLVGIGERTIEALRDYIVRFRGEQQGALFLGSRSGQPIKTAHGLHVILRRVGEIAGVEHVHPHRFRHTFATWAIGSQAREIDVQTLLGHTLDGDDTAVLAHLLLGAGRRCAREFQPRRATSDKSLMDEISIVLDSGESLIVQLVDGGVEIALVDRWLQRLTREEAWQLAEALDEVATAADED